MKKISFVFFIALFVSSFLLSQVSRGPNNPLWLYHEWMETAGIIERKTLSFDDETVEKKSIRGPWSHSISDSQKSIGQFKYFIESSSFLNYNSGYASGTNDGALWQGKGINAAEKLDINIGNDNLEAQLSFLGWFAQNQDFQVTPSVQTDTGSTIDLVQRYGCSSHSDYSFEGSMIGYANSFFSVYAGIDSYWVGPALYNPIMLSTNAEGFPHIKFGLGPWDASWGQFELRLLYGLLEESEYFNSNSNDNYRFFSGLFVAYRLPFFKNLTFSASRTVISKSANLSFTDFLIPVLPSVPGSDECDQRISLAFRLLFPSIGFETYGEWARNDFAPNISTFLLNPNHSQAYMLGMRKTFDLSHDMILGIGYEMTDLVMNQEGTVNLNGYNVDANFYNHGIVTQGYTNAGQNIGAGIGGGSFVQAIFANLYHECGRLGIFISRLARNQTFIYSNPTPGDEYRMDVEMSVGIDADILWSGFIITPLLEIQTNMNRDYIYGNTVVNLKGSLLVKKEF